jgi:hypothetical protein
MTTKTWIQRAVIGASALALLSISSTSASAQADSRWRAWTGCWTTTMPQNLAFGTSSAVCVLPTDKPSAVEIVTVISGKVTDRMRVDADGQAHASERDGCTGSTTARWSQFGTRVLIKESFNCVGSASRTGSGVMSFTQQYEWLDVRGISTGGSAGVAVAKYQLTSDTTGLPAEVRPALALRGPAANNGVLAASAPLTLADIAEMGTSVDSGVAATWLMERTRDVKLSITGKQLVALADQGVPSAVIDVVVALAHPDVFALNSSAVPSLEERTRSQSSSANAGSYYGSRYPGYYGLYSSPMYDPFDPYFSSYAYYSIYGYGRYGYRGYSPYGYSPYGYSPYGYGYYPGYTPVIVVTRGSGDNQTTSQHGRVVKGQGYSSGTGSTGSSATKASSGAAERVGGGSSGSSSSGSTSSGSTSTGSSSGSSSSGGGDRTAVRRPPQ